MSLKDQPDRQQEGHLTTQASQLDRHQVDPKVNLSTVAGPPESRHQPNRSRYQSDLGLVLDQLSQSMSLKDQPDRQQEGHLIVQVS